MSERRADPYTWAVQQNANCEVVGHTWLIRNTGGGLRINRCSVCAMAIVFDAWRGGGREQGALEYTMWWGDRVWFDIDRGVL